VLFTVFLFQRGSAESKKIGESEAVDRDPRRSRNKLDAPWPVGRGGWLLTLYSNSTERVLSLAVMVVFSIFLRQRSSPESKPVDAPHRQTGSDKGAWLESLSWSSAQAQNRTSKLNAPPCGIGATANETALASSPRKASLKNEPMKFPRAMLKSVSEG
jgi:hypothetical protein